MYFIFSLFIISLFALTLFNSQKSFYTYESFIPESTYDVSTIPSDSNFQTNNTCITYNELIIYNYTAPYLQSQNWNKIIPENFCYSSLSYNITREDFFNIINKNLRIV